MYALFLDRIICLCAFTSYVDIYLLIFRFPFMALKCLKIFVIIIMFHKDIFVLTWQLFSRLIKVYRFNSKGSLRPFYLKMLSSPLFAYEL